MNKLKYLLTMLLLTQVISAKILPTPEIIKITNNLPTSYTALIQFKGEYDENTHFKVFSRGLLTTVERTGRPKKKGEISFFTRNKYDYSIQIQAFQGTNRSERSQAVYFTSKQKFEVSAGKAITTILGHPISLNGTVTHGDKNEIAFYRWEENGEVLHNTEDDEIIYWDYENRENDYIAKKEGTHLLYFIVTDLEGKEYKHFLTLRVIKATAIPANTLNLDMKGIQANHKKMTIKLGESISLSGRLNGDRYKQLVDFYHWEKDGKVLNNLLDDEILYWDEENRENDYRPTKSGIEHLKFVVTDIYGEEVNKELTLIIRANDSKDDHGDNRREATKIVLNETVHGKKDSPDDHDFFSFTLNKKQFTRVRIHYDGSSNKQATVYTNELDKIKSHRSIPGTSRYRPINMLLEAGIYYVDAHFYDGSYTLKITTEDIAPDDEHGDTRATATKITVNSSIKSYINTTKDKDYFYFIAPKNGVITLETKGLPMSKFNNESAFTHFNKINVEKGKKYYILVNGGFTLEGQHDYKLIVSFE